MTAWPVLRRSTRLGSLAIHEPGLDLLRYSRDVRRTLRLLLICLLSLALPFKALAGVAMIGCGPKHHASMVRMAAAKPIVPAEASDGYAAHAMHASQSLSHREPTADAAASAGGAATPDSTKPARDHGAKAAKGKCSSCAPCCAAAAPAPDHDRWPTAEPAHRESPFRADRYSGVTTDVPHEPPRLILA